MQRATRYDDVDRLAKLLTSQLPADAHPSLLTAAVLHVAQALLLERFKVSPCEPSQRALDAFAAIGKLADDLTSRAR